MRAKAEERRKRQEEDAKREEADKIRLEAEKRAKEVKLIYNYFLIIKVIIFFEKQNKNPFLQCQYFFVITKFY